MKYILTVLLLSASQVTLASTDAWTFSGSLVVTHQSALKSHLDDDRTASADLVIIRKDIAGQWLAHFEGYTLSHGDHVSNVLPETNADTYSDNDEKSIGQVQLSELFYALNISDDNVLSFGLLDVASFFEQSRIASDESTQFLGAFFVSNPTIEFPDYTLGVVSEISLTPEMTLRTSLASSKGLAYNPSSSYSKQLRVERGDGVYGIVSLSWETERWLVRSGVWTDTEDHQTISSTKNSNNNYGAFFLSGYTLGAHSVNARLGFANPSISQAASFASVAYQYEWDRYTFGAAMGRAFLTYKEKSTLLDDTEQYETYLRYKIDRSLFITGDFQYINNSNYGHTPETRNELVGVYGVRLTWLYS